MTASPPHLGVEDLIAGLDDAPMDAAAQMHLFSCPACRTEAARWKAAADGVRVLVGSCAPPPWQSVDILAAPGGPAGRPRRSRLRPRRPRSRYLLAACTAALALAITAAFEVGALTSTGSPVPATAKPSATPAAPNQAGGLLGVSGCSGLDLATGTLSRIQNGTTLELTTADGATVPVETTGSTSVTRNVIGSASDIADGDRVAVRGDRTDGTIAASAVGIAPGGSDSVPIPQVDITFPGPGGGFSSPAAPGSGAELTTGTVENASAYGFTLVLSAGSAVAVTLSTSTPVVETVGSTLQQLQAGDMIAAVGTVGADGAMVADSVAEQDPDSGSGVIGTATNGGRVVQIGAGVVTEPGAQCSPSAVAARALVGTP